MPDTFAALAAICAPVGRCYESADKLRARIDKLDRAGKLMMKLADRMIAHEHDPEVRASLLDMRLALQDALGNSTEYDAAKLQRQVDEIEGALASREHADSTAAYYATRGVRAGGR